MTNDWETIEVQSIIDENARLRTENEQLKSKNRGLQSELQIFKEDVTHSNQIINKLNDENEQLKSSFTEFAKMIEFDMDKGIEVYPKTLLEYIINISKEYGK